MKCPMCGNNTTFLVYSEQVCEDACNVYVECICGYDPTMKNVMDRYEDTWGGTSNDNVMMALRCWNDAISGQQTGDDRNE